MNKPPYVLHTKASDDKEHFVLCGSKKLAKEEAEYMLMRDPLLETVAIYKLHAYGRRKNLIGWVEERCG